MLRFSFSAFLGTLRLSDIFTTTIFITFRGLFVTTLACGHGLILLPVAFSTIGLEDQNQLQSAWKSLEHEDTSSTFSVVDVENNAYTKADRQSTF
jgi:hypothetical protein